MQITKQMRKRKRAEFEKSVKLSFELKQHQLQRIHERLIILEVYLTTILEFILFIPIIGELFAGKFQRNYVSPAQTVY